MTTTKPSNEEIEICYYCEESTKNQEGLEYSWECQGQLFMIICCDSCIPKLLELVQEDCNKKMQVVPKKS